MDDLLDELDESYEHLYKVHTGRHVHSESYDSDVDSVTSSMSSFDQLQPPLYTFQELQQNLVVIEAQTEDSEIFNSREQSNLSEELQIGTSCGLVQGLPKDNEEKSEMLILRAQSSEKIAKHLSELVTPTYCYICKKHANGHIDHSNHFRKVINWLKCELRQHDLLEVNMKFLFCEVCNLALSGNETAQKHYEEIFHIKNAKFFCLPCLRKVKKTSMATHLQSKRHILDKKKNEDILGQIPELTTNSMIAEAMPDTQNNKQMRFSETSSENPNSDCLSFADVLKANNENNNPVNPLPGSVTRKDIERENKPAIVKDYTLLAQYILNLLSPTFCYICNMPAVDHYKTMQHNQKFLKWIVGSRHILEVFKIQNFDSLICFACRAVFFSSNFADLHYESEEHKRTLENYCKICMTRVDPKSHTEHNGILENEEHLRNKLHVNSEINKGILVNAEKQNENKGENLNECDPGKMISTKLVLLITPIYCYICQKGVNMHSLSNHYLERDHIIMLRKWLTFEIQKSGAQIDPRLIYCEACNLELCGIALALNHYQMAFHIYNQQTYCAVCIVRGTPTAIFQHNHTLEHQYNSETLRLFYLQNTGYTKMKPVSEGTKSIPVPIELAITLSECKLCGVMFHNKEEAHIHYSSKSHNIYVNIWLEKNMLGTDNKGKSELASHIDESNVARQEESRNKLNSADQSMTQKTLYCTGVDLIKLKSPEKPKIQKKSKNKLENPISPSVPKELAMAITLNECKLCCIIFHDIEDANVHYSSENHNIHVINWLEKNNMSTTDTKLSDSPIGETNGASQQDYRNKLSVVQQDTAQNTFDCTEVDLIELKVPQKPEIEKSFDIIDSSCDQILKDKKTYIKPKNVTPKKQLRAPSNQNSHSNIKQLQSEEEIIEKNITSHIPIIKLPTGNYNNKDEAQINKSINDQVRKLLNKVYCSNAVPKEKSLMMLKKFNEDLTNAETYYTRNTESDADSKIDDLMKKQYENIDTSNSNKQNIGNNKTNTCDTDNNQAISNTLQIIDIVDDRAHIKSESIQCKIGTGKICDTLFSSRNEMRDSREDCITQFILQRKSLLEYERKSLSTIKNISISNDDNSSNSVLINGVLGTQLNNVQENVAKSNNGCILM